MRACGNITALLGALAGLCCGCSGGDEPTEYAAEVMCEEFVGDRLKSPASAEFSQTRSSADGEGAWTVRGVLDSDNSFGASLRTGYTCKVRYLGDGSWRLVDLRFDGR